MKRRFANPPVSRSRRRGVSLIELLIVMAIAAVIITLTMTTIHLLLRSERDQARAVWTTVTISRLEQVFREDIHATTPTALLPEHEHLSRLVLTTAAGREIHYIAGEHVLERVESLEGDQTHRDQFHFPLGTQVRFERDESPTLVRIVLDVAPAIPHQMPEPRADRPRGARPRTLILEAVADRDRRFERGVP